MWGSVSGRLGFRTERIQPLNLKDGVTIRRRLPLDGSEGHAKLEVRANLCLPEPEVRQGPPGCLSRRPAGSSAGWEGTKEEAATTEGWQEGLRLGASLVSWQIEYSTDKKRLIMGTGDIQVSIDELNLCLEY